MNFSKPDIETSGKQAPGQQDASYPGWIPLRICRASTRWSNDEVGPKREAAQMDALFARRRCERWGGR